MTGRSFHSFLGGVGAAWPRAQQRAGMRRVGVLHFSEQDPEAKAYIATFLKQLGELGWTVGNNLQVDYRWTGGLDGHIHEYAAELVALEPDVILAAGDSHVGPLQQITHSVPIVFVQVTDAVGGGLVKSLARPGGNATGFTNFEFDIGGKWLELAKQIAPLTTRVAVLRDPHIFMAPNWPVPLEVAGSLGVEVSPMGLPNASEIERGISEFAEKPNGGLIISPNPFAIAHRELIISLASRYRLPAIYPSRYFATEGGLISFGPDAADQYRRAASYADRILKGKKPAKLPVEQSTKVALVINTKNAKALELEVPPKLLAIADEVIQ
jgi:putative ABC transport system substrate-binding protein